MSSYQWSPLESGSGSGVTSLNALTGALTLAAGTGITITDNGSSTITITSSSAGDVTIGAFGSTPNANGLSISGSQVLNLQPADATHPGGLSAADWNTFNGKQAAGNYITALTSDVTATGPGSVASTIAAIQGTTVSGVTGSTNVVFSNAPTLTNPIVGTQSQGNSSTRAASTAYVDVAVANAVAGINPAVAVQAATTSASDTSGFSYNNGVSGVGATLTGPVNTALTVDGYTFTAIGQRLLVKNDTQSPSGAYNGVYYVTQVQTAILPLVLTRALDYNQPSDINNTGAIPVINGTANGTTSWVETALITTVGTDPLTFVEFTRNPADYLLKANNLSDVASSSSAFNNLSAMTLLGDINYGGASGTRSVLAGNTSATKKYLSQTGNGSVSAAPAWSQPAFSELSGSVAASQMPALTGDVTTSAGAVATTLATVNSNVGSFGSSTSIPSFTVNGKGLITAASGNVVIAPAGTLTGTTLASNVVTSSLTAIGTIATGVWQGTKIGLAYGGTNADLSATGGTSNVLKQSSSGAAITVGQLAFSDISSTVSSSQVTTATFTAPTVQIFTSGSAATYTTPTSPRGPLYITVEIWGGGGGGGGSGTGAGTAAGDGGSSLWKDGAGSSTLISAGGGTKGTQTTGGSGGTNTVSGPTTILNVQGTAGGGNAFYSAATGTAVSGGAGGMSPVLNGGGVLARNSEAGAAGVANTGGGGQGGGTGNTLNVASGSGGGSGGYVKATIASPASTYQYTVGASGSAGGAGTSGLAGGAGAAGRVVVTEYYQ